MGGTLKKYYDKKEINFTALDDIPLWEALKCHLTMIVGTINE